MSRQLTEYGLRFLASHEGLVNYPYLDSAGLLTIGVGHLCLEGGFYLKGQTIKQLTDNILRNRKNFLVRNTLSDGTTKSFFAVSSEHVRNTFSITEQETMVLYRKDISRFLIPLQRNIRAPLTDNQFAACLSLTFNIGLGVRGGTRGFLASSLLKYIEAGQFSLIRGGFERFKFAEGKESKGLLKRRQEEADLFFTPDNIEQYPIKERKQIVKLLETELSFTSSRVL